MRFRLLVSVISTTLISSAAFGAKGYTLLTDLRIKLGQTTASNSNWTNAEIYRCLNMAQDWVSGQGRVVEKTRTTAGDTLRYTVPADFIKLKGTAWLWRNGREIKPIPLISEDSAYRVMERVGSVRRDDKHHITEAGGKVLVIPKISAQDSIVYGYYAHATVLDSATECDYGREWEQVLLAAAKVVALEKISSPELPLAIQERDKLVAAMYQQVTSKPQLVEVP